MGGLAAGLIIATLVLAWVLSRGPISLSLITPYVSDYLQTAIPEVQTEFDDTILIWTGWEQAVDLQIVNLRIRANEDTIIASIPKVSIGLSTKGLLAGVIAPSSMKLYGPTLHLIRPVDGNVNMAFAGIAAVMSGRMEPFLKRASQQPNPTELLSYLKKIQITDADVIVEDTAKAQSWVTPDIHITVNKVDGRVNLETSFLVDMEEKIAEVSFIAGYEDATKRIDAGISFSHVMPAVLGRLTKETAFLRYIDVPVQGTVTLASSVDGVLESVGFDLVGGQGQIKLPAPLSGNLKTNSIVFNGFYDALTQRVEVSELRAEVSKNQSVILPAPVSHSYPISNFTYRGSFDGVKDLVLIDNLDANLGGLIANLKGSVSNVSKLQNIALNLDVPEIMIADLPTYWPHSAGPDAHEWVMSNVLEGAIQNLSVEFNGNMTNEGGFDLIEIDGGFVANDGAMLYLDGMPPISDIESVVVFDHDQIDFAITGAKTHDLEIGSGLVSISGITSNPSKAEIRLGIDGQFQKVMELLNREPMLFATEMGIDPASVEGKAKIELAVDIPLILDLKEEDITFSAHALAQDVSVPEGLFDLDVDQGMLNLTIDNSGMDVKGNMQLNNYPTSISWRQNFNEDAAFVNQYELSMHLSDISSFDDLGIDVKPFSADMIAGEIPLKLKVTQKSDGPINLEATASLDDLRVSVPAINWYKPVGVPGQAQATFHIENGDVVEIPEFMLHTDELEIIGTAHYASAGEQLDRIELSRIKYGRTEISGILVPSSADAWDADFRGASLDLSPVWDDIFYGDLSEAGEGVLENLSVSTQFDKVWLSDTRSIDNMTGAFVQADDKWRTVYITANIGDGETLGIKLSPSELKNRRILTAWSTDAGSVLRTFDFYDTMIGGDLSLTGHFDDDEENSPLYGYFHVDDYRIIKAPALAKVVSIMSLTGIADALQGEGLGFDTLHIPFKFGEGVLELREAKATGASIGFTAAGKLYTQANAVDVSGTMVPVYAFNSLLGNIPIIGNVFSGGEEGGGIFAADYYISGAIDNPEITVNPLSMLTPGFLRNIFNVFETAPSEGPPQNNEQN